MLDALIWIGIWALGVLCGTYGMYLVERTRGVDLDRAAEIAGRYQAAREAGDIAERERRERFKSKGSKSTG